MATDFILSKPVVLKVRALHKINDPYVSKNLKQEPAIMAKLNHPIIVFLHRIVSVGDFYCLLPHLYPGANLCDIFGSQEGFKLPPGGAGLTAQQEHQSSSIATSSWRTSCWPSMEEVVVELILWK